MKKSLKTQMKKSISLFLAVLMILSCWVWVAPEKASADHTTGQYYIKYVGNITETGNLNSSTVEGNSLIVYWTKTDGTTGSTNITPALSKMTSTANNFVMYEGYIDGFPTSISWYLKFGWEAASSRYFNWRDVSLYVGKDKNSCTTKVTNTDHFKWQNDAVGSGTKEGTFTLSKIDGVDPVLQVPTYADQTVSIPTLTSKDTIKTAEINPVYYDQYGVKYVGTSASYMLTESEGSTTPIGGEESGFYIVTDKNTGKYHAEITSQMQIGVPSDGSINKTFYLRTDISATDISGNGVDRVAVQKIHVTYPTYTVNVYSNGGSMVMSDNETSNSDWSNTGVYGKEPEGSYPTGTAERTGYTFLGLWTVPQPSESETIDNKSFDASVNAYESSAAIPVSAKDFENYYEKAEAEDKHGNYVTVGNKTYYNAGQLWDKATSRRVSGEATYYAWWLAKDIPVKFYDIDGSYLGKVVYKYGIKLEDKEAPIPTLDKYVAGAFTYTTFTGIWNNIDGTPVGDSFVFGSDGLYSYTLTPTYEKKEYKDTYDVTFVKPDESDITKTYEYRHVLSGTEILASVAIPGELSTDLAYSYKFKGWTTQSPASTSEYLVVDNDDTVVVINEDWVVRNNVTYYPVFERTIKSYAVMFFYLDTTGTLATKAVTVKYGSLFTTPEDINLSYAQDGKSYNLLKWKYKDAENKDAYLAIGESLIFNSDNIKITDANIAGGTPINFTSNYDNGTYKPYDIVFKYKDVNGKDYRVVKEVTHGDEISEEIVNSIINSVPAQYDDGNALYTFSNSWLAVEGTASTEPYKTDDLASFAPTSNVVFEAIYDSGVPFYTVTYIDGAAKYTERVLQGSKLPAWMLNNGETIFVYVPKDYETPTGIYKFVGWFNEKQTDENCKQTNGKQYTTDSAVTENDVVEGTLTLYPQYIYEAYKFKIEFVGFDGEVLASGEFEVDESFKDIYDLAEIAARKRAADEVYSYTFIGWDSSVGNLVCDGKPIRFTARYRSNYIYYPAKWYNSIDDINGEPLTVTQHTFGSSVYNPSVDLVVPAGKVFDGWYYTVNGDEKAFERGMAIKGEMIFYAKYKDAEKIHTVTTVVDGVNTDYKVADKGTANAIVAPEYIYVGEYTDENGEVKNGHKVFVGWYKDATYSTAFDLSETITGNITVYAKYNTVEHTFITDEIISDPTYYDVGSKIEYCICDRTKTRTVEIPMLTDTVKPTGAIQLGSHKWSSTDATGAAATDNEDVSIFANADTDIIITVNDTGDVSNEYNPGGIGKGIKIIRAFVSKGVYGQGTTEGQIAGIQTVYENATEDLNNVANYVVRLGSYEGLVDGETYIVYYYVSDKAGNILNEKVRTAKFVYDITAPEFEIVGNNNKTSIPTYCGEATVTGIEENAIVTVNGVEVEVTYTVVDGKNVGSYVIDEANNYVITVTDRAGNTTSKKIKVAAEHNNVTTIVNSTCTEDGYKKVECAVCEYVSENTTYKTTGHEWSYSFVPATCEEDGYNIKTCEFCGEIEISKEVNGALIQEKLGHIYPMDDGAIVYTVVTAATCVSEGLKVANCTRCGGGTLSEKIAVDTENGHNYGSVKTLKPTCTEDGKTYQRCKYCYYLLDGQKIEATGHQEKYTVVLKEATCSEAGKKAEYCKKCDVKVGEDIVIDATGKHIFEATDNVKEPTGTEDGYIVYACKTCSATKIETIDKLEVFDITFVAEDGETVIVEILDKVVGSTISEDVLKDENNTSLIPVKESDNEYSYAFAGWVDENGKTVKLPFDVSDDVTLTATYKATRRIYTHKFMVPTKWATTYATEQNSNVQYGDNIIGYYGDVNMKPNTIPKFTDADAKADEELKAKYTFKFLGWSTTGAVGDIVEDFTTYQMTGDADFIAVFQAELKEYNVIFSKKNGDLLWSTTVAAGESVKYEGSNPSYYDSNYHYTFNKWLRGATEYAYDATIENILADTKLVVDYTKTAHKFETVTEETWVPTCYREGQLTEKCECGYIRVTTTPMTDHSYSNTPDANGKLVCQNEGCGHSIDAEAKFVTITFVVDGKEVSVQVAEGDTYKFTAPAKESSASHDYPFNAWFKDDKEYSKSQTITITAGSTNETYFASYGETIRKYRVTYFDFDHEIFVDNDGKACTGLYEYGSQIPAKPEKKPTRNYDTTFHYVFTGWQVVAGSAENKKVEGDIEYYATYDIIKHNFVENTEDATCTKVGGKTMTCECGYSYPVGSVIPMIPHTEGKVLEKTEATIYGDGVYRYICASCGEEQKEVVPMLEKTNIAIRVYDGEGKKAAYVTVKVYYTVIENGQTTFVEYKTTTGYSYLTNADGFVNVVAPAGYEGWRVSIYYNGGSYSGELKTGGVENVFGGPKVEEPESECGCTCHKSGLWGSFYRFIQKILRMFGAKPCCADQNL